MKRSFSKKPISASSNRYAIYTFYFGDGDSAASRGTDVEHDCKLTGKLDSDEMASLAVLVLNDLPDNFTREDVLDILEDDWGCSEDEIFDELAGSAVEDTISQLDVSGGDPLVYKVTKNGGPIFYDKYMEEEVKAAASDYDD